MLTDEQFAGLVVERADQLDHHYRKIVDKMVEYLPFELVVFFVAWQRNGWCREQKPLIAWCDDAEMRFAMPLIFVRVFGLPKLHFLVLNSDTKMVEKIESNRLFKYNAKMQLEATDMVTRLVGCQVNLYGDVPLCKDPTQEYIEHLRFSDFLSQKKKKKKR